MTSPDAQAHAARMRKKEAAQQKIATTKTIEKGLLIVHTGRGKGKTTAALGMVLRGVGHGQRVGVVQFVKSEGRTGEKAALDHFPGQVEFKAMGEGSTWKTQDRDRDIAAARLGWMEVVRMIADPAYDMVVADELTIVLRYNYLPLEEVLAVLNARPPMKHVVVTGRNAPQELIDAADIVTEMTLVKHGFRSGIKAQAGIEF
ncbi:cob(I)yrinic acid a,c-diamide adenosyltransferase [Sphingobium sufflavum]|uniref:cob(I)yrinic acid a,c-diamide adenosyltransferase n=1 Tax=Sphingobium sufflavum TaxID=1129547 RepID=UPI001F18F8F1|nr:cob(I)yrinic acid a,c-diamide adenosyltransferase [Sphingobium sufflavum]MCE7797206.1 cob(I)yrinic acid a,c-diamide adenosyltransferase [Sphingobium sufflavum]